MSRLALPLAIGLLAVAFLTGAPAAAQRQDGGDRPMMSAGIAEDRIEVQVNYSGSEIVVFTAMPQPENDTLGLAVALVGKMTPQVMIRHTAQGDQRIQFVAAPEVFVFGEEKAVTDTVTPETMVEAGLSARSAALPRIEELLSPELEAWRTALVDLKTDQGLYTTGRVQFRHFEGGLRRANIELPLNAPPGEYTVKAVAFRNGRMVGESRQTFTLARGGLDATLFDLSQQHGLVYGFVAVFLGALVGGIAAWLQRK